MAAVVVAVALAVCPRGSGAEEPAAVTGRVVDGRSGAALAGATVVIVDGAERTVVVRSDRSGHFHAIGLAPGQFDVDAELAGFDGAVDHCRVPSGETLLLELHAYRVGRRPPAQAPPPPCRLAPATSDRYIIE